jgi:hypothetical protein
MSSMTEPEKVCFVIAPIGEDGSDVRARSDRVFNYVIEPAARECGYKALRADKISTPGIITNQVIQEVINAPMVVADLTGHNANAFYELAVRHMVKKSLVQMITKGEKIPFDLAASRVLYYEEPALETVERTRTELIDHIRSAEGGGGDSDNPISVSVERHALRASGNPLETQVAELADALTAVATAIRSDIADLRTQVAEARNANQQFVGLRAIALGEDLRLGSETFREIARRAYNVRSQDQGSRLVEPGIVPPPIQQPPGRPPGTTPKP